MGEEGSETVIVSGEHGPKGGVTSEIKDEQGRVWEERNGESREGIVMSGKESSWRRVLEGVNLYSVAHMRPIYQRLHGHRIIPFPPVPPPP